jgi:hypothetical protein
MILHSKRMSRLLTVSSTKSFSTADKKPLVVAKKKPVMVVSEYGELLNVKPMIKTKPETIYREV